MFSETDLAENAKSVASIAMDVSEILMKLNLPAGEAQHLTVAYHAACSLQHGQQIKTFPKDLLKKAGFTVAEPSDSHLCCGSAGTYNLMQPEISKQLKAFKVQTLEAVEPDIIAAGNIGCMMQIGGGTDIPIVHTVELLDWATGGPKPPHSQRLENGHLRYQFCVSATISPNTNVISMKNWINHAIFHYFINLFVTYAPVSSSPNQRFAITRN